MASELCEVVMTVLPATREWTRGFRWYCRSCDKYAEQIFDSELDAHEDAKKHAPKGDAKRVPSCGITVPHTHTSLDVCRYTEATDA